MNHHISQDITTFPDLGDLLGLYPLGNLGNIQGFYQQNEALILESKYSNSFHTKVFPKSPLSQIQAFCLNNNLTRIARIPNIVNNPSYNPEMTHNNLNSIPQSSILVERGAKVSLTSSKSNFFLSSAEIQAMVYDNLNDLATELYCIDDLPTPTEKVTHVKNNILSFELESPELLRNRNITVASTFDTTKSPGINDDQLRHDSDPDVTIEIGLIKNKVQQPNKCFSKRAWSGVKEALKSILLFAILMTITSHLHDALYMYMHGDELRAEFGAEPETKVQELSAQADFTLLMITKNRDTYQYTMNKFVEVPRHGLNPFFLVIDWESTNPINTSVPETYFIRKEPGPVPEPYNQWKSMSYAAKAVKSERIFYFDSCNWPWNHLNYTYYLDLNTNLYFPNYDREYSSSFLAYREDFVRFIEDLPLHIAKDPRTFFGGDQLMIWYFSSFRGEYFIHVAHEAGANYGEAHTHHIAIWRLFLYMNRYARPVVRPNDMESGKCRAEKQILCVHGAIVSKFLALPGIWHFIDALMNFEFIFALLFKIVNMSGSWLWGFVIAIGFTFFSIILFMYFVRKITWKAYTFVKSRISQRNGYQRF